MPRSSKRVKASRTNGASNAVTFAMLDDMNISVRTQRRSGCVS